MTRKSKITLGVVGGGIVLPLVVIFAVLSYLVAGQGRIRSSYPAADYDPMLTREAKKALPLIQAIDRYRAEHASLPATEADLGPYLPAGFRPRKASAPYVEDAKPPWRYTRLGDARYDLYFKLDWDPSLNYHCEGSKGYWYFDPGDGSSIKILKLNP